MLPPVLSETLTPAALSWTLQTPGVNHAIYAGHFPGHPVLPGVVALGWMLAAAERFLGRALSESGAATLHNVKFQVVLLPGQLVGLTVTPQSTAGRLAARLTSEKGTHASVLIEPVS